MALSTLKDRVRAATTAHPGAVSSSRNRAESTEHSTAPVSVEEAIEQDPQQEAADAVLTWLSRYEGHVTAALPSHLEVGPFLAAVRNVLPGLQRCTPASILQAVMTCARFGLVPDGREAALTAQFGRAVFIPTYRGYIKLMHQSGLVESVRCGVIYEADEWDFTPSAPSPLDFTLRQRPELSAEERGKPILVYAFAWLKGGHRSQVVTVNREQAERVRDEHSVAYQEAEASGSHNSFWHLRFDDMWWKTGLRQLEKVVPLSAELRALVAADDAGDAGAVQILHAPDPEAVALTATAERAHEAAEGSQEKPSATPLPRKRSASRRAQPKRVSRKARGGSRPQKGRRR